ncbi:MAG: hypothetical protein AB1465_06600 [Patescibacteria group bacterium]
MGKLERRFFVGFVFIATSLFTQNWFGFGKVCFAQGETKVVTSSRDPVCERAGGICLNFCSRNCQGKCVAGACDGPAHRQCCIRSSSRGSGTSSHQSSRSIYSSRKTRFFTLKGAEILEPGEKALRFGGGFPELLYGAIHLPISRDFEIAPKIALFVLEPEMPFTLSALGIKIVFSSEIKYRIFDQEEFQIALTADPGLILGSYKQPKLSGSFTLTTENVFQMGVRFIDPGILLSYRFLIGKTPLYLLGGSHLPIRIYFVPSPVQYYISFAARGGLEV